MSAASPASQSGHHRQDVRAVARAVDEGEQALLRERLLEADAGAIALTPGNAAGDFQLAFPEDEQLAERRKNAALDLRAARRQVSNHHIQRTRGGDRLA